MNGLIRVTFAVSIVFTGAFSIVSLGLFFVIRVLEHFHASDVVTGFVLSAGLIGFLAFIIAEAKRPIILVKDKTQ